LTREQKVSRQKVTRKSIFFYLERVADKKADENEEKFLSREVAKSTDSD
jgi:hypothetical protein